MLFLHKIPAFHSFDHNIFLSSEQQEHGKAETKPKKCVYMGKVLRFLVLFGSRVVGLSLRASYCWRSSEWRRNARVNTEHTTMAIWIYKYEKDNEGVIVKQLFEMLMWMELNVRNVEERTPHFEYSAQSEIKCTGKIKSQKIFSSNQHSQLSVYYVRMADVSIVRLQLHLN